MARIAKDQPYVLTSANPGAWGVALSSQIEGHKTVANLTELYALKPHILSEGYNNGVTTGADAIGQLWYVQDQGKFYRLKNWSNRANANGWEIAPFDREATSSQSGLMTAADKSHLDALQSVASGGMRFIGVTSTALTDGATTSSLTAATTGSLEKTSGFTKGDMVIYGKGEFVWTGSSWAKLGDTTTLGSLASKNSASGSITGVPTSTHTHSTNITHTHTVTQGTVSASGNFTPSGSVSVSDRVYAGVAGYVNPKYVGTGGTVLTEDEFSEVSIRGVAGTTSVNSLTSVGTMFAASVSGECLTLTAGSAPTYTAKTVATANAAATSFKALDDSKVDDATSGKTLGELVQARFSGTQGSVSVSGTTAGVSVAQYSGSKTSGAPSATETKTVTVS